MVCTVSSRNEQEERKSIPFHWNVKIEFGFTFRNVKPHRGRRLREELRAGRRILGAWQVCLGLGRTSASRG
jgi:hypothetical protein